MDVVVVNHNARRHLRACLQSVFADGPGRVVVVDNASTDRSEEMVRREFASATVLANRTNVGYAAAANEGMRNCDSPYVLLLNGDTAIHRGCLSTLTGYLDMHSRAGVAGPLLLNSDGSIQPSCFPVPGTLQWLLDNDVVAPWLQPVPRLGRGFLRTWAHDQPRTVPWVSGAALAIRRSAFDSIGGFDESFFMYCEEIDLCCRMSDGGYEVHFVPVAATTHARAVSTSQYGHSMEYHLRRSMLRFFVKRYSPVRSAMLSALYSLVSVARRARSTLSPVYRGRSVRSSSTAYTAV